MQVTIDPAELAPIIAATVSEVMQRIRDDEAALGDRLAFSEHEATSQADAPRREVASC